MKTLTAAEILAIPLSVPEKLFSAPQAVLREYQVLAKLWHPDVNKSPEANDVLAHLNQLRNAADERVASGTWTTPGVFSFEDVRGRKFNVRYGARQSTEYGDVFYGRTVVIFRVGRGLGDLVKRHQSLTSRFKYASAEMEAEIGRYLPSGQEFFETPDGWVIVMKKTADVYLLRHLLVAMGGQMNVAQMAWIISSLLNLACYLEYAGLTHNALNLDSVFVSPKYHSALPLGGWLYGARVGERLLALPAQSARLAPPSLLKSKSASTSLDLTLIRALGRELLGDPTGHRLSGRVPNHVLNFLRLPPAPKARDDYASWHGALEASFGQRRFTKLDIPESAIYTT